jgi:hypothetical protein
VHSDVFYNTTLSFKETIQFNNSTKLLSSGILTEWDTLDNYCKTKVSLPESDVVSSMLWIMSGLDASEKWTDRQTAVISNYYLPQQDFTWEAKQRSTQSTENFELLLSRN